MKRAPLTGARTLTAGKKKRTIKMCDQIVFALTASNKTLDVKQFPGMTLVGAVPRE